MIKRKRGEIKTLNLVKEYGGIDQLIEDVENTFFDRGNKEMFVSDFIETVLWVLKDYKRVKEQNKWFKRKIKEIEHERAWPMPESMKIGYRHEMGG